jgi:biopolymer transport protein ExbD
MMQEKPKNKATLAQFSVELSQDGKVYLENKIVNPDTFREVMDEWNQDYEGTLSLTNLLREFRREFEDLKEKAHKFLI